MNNKLSIPYFILIITPLFFGCGPVKEENKNNAPENSLSLHTGDEKYFIIDTKASVIVWKGAMQIGSDFHAGYVSVSKGELMIENDQLVGGTVEVDMNTIEDETHRSDNNLIQHLKDADFFDVKRYPVAAITITGVESTNGENKKITGNLAIKGITHPVTFPATIEVKDGLVKANGKLVIDRTKWDVRYRSGKLYDGLADKAISDSVEFHVKIVAKNSHLNP